MTRLLISTAAIALLSGAAVAADLPVYEPAPVIAPVPVGYDWSGFYVGLQGGWGWGDSDIEDDFLLDTSIDIDGGYAGGVLGAQWQWNWLVFGAEGELNWSNIDGKEDLGDAPGGNFFETEIDWFGSLNGKLGIAVNRFMVYGTGGVAFADIETGQNVPSFGIAFSESENYVGWTAGGGLDVAVTDHVIVGLQYRYYDFGDEDFSPGGAFTDRNQDVTLHTVSAHVTYKFGGGGM